MRGRILLLFLVLLLIFGCTPDLGDENVNYTSSSSDSSSNSDGNSGDSDDERGDIAKNEIWNIDDFSDLLAHSIVDIVPYSGWISQEELVMGSSLSDYYSYEEDMTRREYYSFDGVLAYYDSGEAIFYIKNINGWISYVYDEEQEHLESGETIETSVGPASLSVMARADEPAKSGTVSLDGEYEFSVYPRYFTDATSVTTQRKVIYSDGSSDISDVSIDFSMLSAGGGSDADCSADTSDNSVSGPSRCKLYLSGLSMGGTYVDSIYQEDEGGFETHIMRTEWSLVPLGGEPEGEVSEDFKDTEGFDAWLESI